MERVARGYRYPARSLILTDKSQSPTWVFVQSSRLPDQPVVTTSFSSVAQFTDVPEQNGLLTTSS